MIFIRPKILRDSVQTAFETNAKYNYIREVQQQGRGGDGGRVAIMPFEDRPVLPPLEEYTQQPQAIDLRNLEAPEETSENNEEEEKEDVQMDVSQ